MYVRASSVAGLILGASHVTLGVLSSVGGLMEALAEGLTLWEISDFP